MSNTWLNDVFAGRGSIRIQNLRSPIRGPMRTRYGFNWCFLTSKMPQMRLQPSTENDPSILTRLLPPCHQTHHRENGRTDRQNLRHAIHARFDSLFCNLRLFQVVIGPTRFMLFAIGRWAMSPMYGEEYCVSSFGVEKIPSPLNVSSRCTTTPVPRGRPRKNPEPSSAEPVRQETAQAVLVSQQSAQASSSALSL